MKRPNVFLPPSPLRWQLFLTPKDRCYLLLLLLRVFGVCGGGGGFVYSSHSICCVSLLACHFAFLRVAASMCTAKWKAKKKKANDVLLMLLAEGDSEVWDAVPFFSRTTLLLAFPFPRRGFPPARARSPRKASVFLYVKPILECLFLCVIFSFFFFLASVLLCVLYVSRPVCEKAGVICVLQSLCTYSHRSYPLPRSF
jgi:hypothetical protein